MNCVLLKKQITSVSNGVLKIFKYYAVMGAIRKKSNYHLRQYSHTKRWKFGVFVLSVNFNCCFSFSLKLNRTFILSALYQLNCLVKKRALLCRVDRTKVRS